MRRPNPPAFPPDPNQALERTCFQTGGAWSPFGNLRSDVAIVYGIDPQLPDRIQTWRDRGYRIHVMTGVSWGSYQDYLYGRFDGINHEDERKRSAPAKRSVSAMCITFRPTRMSQISLRGVQRAYGCRPRRHSFEERNFYGRVPYSED